MSNYEKYGSNDTPVSTDGDVIFLRVNNRLRPDQLKSGDIADGVNGRMDLDGAWQVRRGIETFGPTLTANTRAIQLTSPTTWKLYDATPIGIDATGASRSTTTVTVNTTGAHGFTSNTLVCIAGLSGTVDPNGNRLITVTDTDTFTFDITGATGSETYTGPGTAEGAELSASQVSGVYGSCLFSDPSDDNARYIIRATNLSAVAVSLDDGSSAEIAYPSGITLSSAAAMVQAFDKVFIFRDGMTALEWNGDMTGAFTEVADGTYTQPTYYNTATNAVIADGVVTVTEAAHGLSAGDAIHVIDNGNSALSETEPYIVATVPTTGAFTFNAQVPDVTGQSMVFSKRVSGGSGFMHMPYPAWGTYHQGRLWVPYKWELNATGATTRNKTDELAASDVLDSNTYDRLDNQFRVTAGISDYVVAVEPFAEDNLLCFNRNSIHLIKGVSGNLADTSTWLITKEIGCVARQSIQQVGNQVIFLSDNGVYAAAFGDLYNLRGAGVPLSEPIKGWVERINRNYAHKCVSAYFNNRYYLAFPLDTSEVNNAILVYNFLNGGWESLDTVNDSAWNIQNLIVGDTGGLAKLFAIGSAGSIHVIDEREDGSDQLALLAGIAASSVAVAGSITTRQYTHNDIGRKSFKSYELHVQSSDSESSDGTIGVSVENYDYDATLTTVATLNGGAIDAGEDASLRGRIGNKRGYGIQMIFTPTNGRPKLRAVSVNASTSNRAVSKAL